MSEANKPGHLKWAEARYNRDQEWLAGEAERVKRITAQRAHDQEVIAALLAACEASVHVWEQGCVDRGWKDEPNWIDETLDQLRAAIALAKESDTYHIPHSPLCPLVTDCRKRLRSDR